MSWDSISSVRIFLRWDWNTMVEPYLVVHFGTFFHPPKKLSQTSCHCDLPGQLKLVGSLNIRKSFRMALEIHRNTMNYILIIYIKRVCHNILNIPIHREFGFITQSLAIGDWVVWSFSILFPLEELMGKWSWWAETNGTMNLVIYHKRR